MDKKYIDAEHFKRRVMAAAFELNDNAMYNVAKEICEMVDFESAADVAPVVHGEWEYYTHTMMACSICKRHVPRHKSEYCPHCGAKMDGGTP